MADEETLKRARRAEDFIEGEDQGDRAVPDEALKRWKETTGLTSPEGIMMMLIAIALDAPSIILLVFGLDDFFILDIVAVITIGLWFFLRSFSVEATDEMTKLGRRIRTLRFFLSLFGELIPYIGALPLWTLFTYLELKS